MCQLHDHVVVRDPRSRSGWRFRTSYHRATESLRRAFQVLPAVYRDYREGWYGQLELLLSTQPAQARLGHTLPPDTGAFAAYLSWSATGDTAEVVPYRLSEFMTGRGASIPTSRREAVRHQRLVFRDIATTWRTALPNNADAMVALSIALDELGDPTALDSARAARLLATEADERLRAGSVEVWLRVKLGVPSDVASLRLAASLADSLVRESPNPRPALVPAAASLASLVGHANQAAAISRLPAAEPATTIPG